VLVLQCLEVVVNTGAPWPTSDEAWWRVQRMQTKLHQWALDDPNRRFMDLFNLVYDPAFLVVAWERVRETGGTNCCVDGVKPRSIVFGEHLLAGLRDDLKAERFTPLPVRESSYRRKEASPGIRNPRRTRQGCPGSPAASARADLRGGLQAV